MPFSESDLERSVESIWDWQLGLPVRRGGAGPTPRAADALTGWVRITGACRAAVLLACPVPLARRAATVMFGLEPPALTEEHVRDALGELTNILGGNIKPLLAEPASLSAPSVAWGAEGYCRLPAGGPLAQIAFECEQDAFTVQVLREDEPSVP